jgi:ribonuclease HI
VYTTSDYVARGARLWAHRWAARGFRTQEGAAVKHEDLWRELLAGSGRGGIEWHALKDGLHPAETTEAERQARDAARATIP